MKLSIYILCFFLLLACGSDIPTYEPDPEPNPDPPPVEEKIDWNLFADNFQKTLTAVYGGRDGTYISRPNLPHFNYWFNAHVMDVLVDSYERTKSEQYLDKMKALLNGVKSFQLSAMMLVEAVIKLGL